MDQIDEAAFYKAKAQVLAENLSRTLDEVTLRNIEIERLNGIIESINQDVSKEED